MFAWEVYVGYYYKQEAATMGEFWDNVVQICLGLSRARVESASEHVLTFSEWPAHTRGRPGDAKSRSGKKKRSDQGLKLGGRL